MNFRVILPTVYPSLNCIVVSIIHRVCRSVYPSLSLSNLGFNSLRNSKHYECFNRFLREWVEDKQIHREIGKGKIKGKSESIYKNWQLNHYMKMTWLLRHPVYIDFKKDISSIPTPYTCLWQRALLVTFIPSVCVALISLCRSGLIH